MCLIVGCGKLYESATAPAARRLLDGAFQLSVLRPKYHPLMGGELPISALIAVAVLVAVEVSRFGVTVDLSRFAVAVD
jgi:hypothetical protein